MTEYYNPSKILNMKDLDGEEPAIYLITNNRSAGKTTAFLKKSLEKFSKLFYCLIGRVILQCRRKLH